MKKVLDFLDKIASIDIRDAIDDLYYKYQIKIEIIKLIILLIILVILVKADITLLKKM